MLPWGHWRPSFEEIAQLVVAGGTERMAEPAEKTATRTAERPDARRSPVLDIDRYVSSRIRERRMVLGLTTEQLAELIGVTRSQMQRYETGVTRIAAGRLYQIAQALGVDVGYVFQEGYVVHNVHPEARSYRDVNWQASAPTGPLKFVAKLQEIWRLDGSELSKLLGFEAEEDLYDLVSGARSLDTRDVKDRVRHLMRIREALHSLFQNLDAERGWLREPRQELQGQSPLALLLEGSMENLLTVSQFAQWMAGR
jgi:transcriptional regulator with XRE-family HTH domain